MSDMTEDMDAEVDRQDRVIQGLRDEIERLTAESKAKDVAYETMQKYVTELEARVEELEDLLDEAFRKLVSMLIHDDEAYSKLQEMADEIERLTAELEKCGVERDKACGFQIAVQGWRENDWPEWFCRRTAEALVERGKAGERNVAAGFEILYATTEQVEKDEL